MSVIWEARRSGSVDNRPGDHRTPWQRDRARVLHSAAFRRLQSKTQILGIGQNDFYRTRLTHSLEAAQIGNGLVSQLARQLTAPLQNLLPDSSLIEALCLAHDLGHPPFGHGGETALNFKMLPYGGFEGNGQTLRIAAKLEPYTEQHGMDLTRRTLLGLLKYPVLQPTLLETMPGQNPLSLAQWKPTKAIFAADHDILDWILAPLAETERQAFQQTEQLNQSPWQRSCYKSLDASIMELADDIAYGVHDLEDAIVLGNLSYQQWQSFTAEPFAQLPKMLQQQLQLLGQQLFSSQHHQRKNAIGSIVNQLITAVALYESLPDCQEPLIRYNARLAEEQQFVLHTLKHLVYRCVIMQPDIQQSRFRSQNMLLQLFDAFSSDPERLLPLNTQARWRAAPDQVAAYRVLCDYISGMTDDYAERMHQTLFGRLGAG